MEHLVFRPINLADIAALVGKDARNMKLTTHGNGVMEIDVPNLSAGNRSKLRALFTSKGFVEDPDWQELD